MVDEDNAFRGMTKMGDKELYIMRKGPFLWTEKVMLKEEEFGVELKIITVVLGEMGWDKNFVISTTWNLELWILFLLFILKVGMFTVLKVVLDFGSLFLLSLLPSQIREYKGVEEQRALVQCFRIIIIIQVLRKSE